MNELIIENCCRKLLTLLDETLVKYDGWFLVFLAVLLGLAFTVFAGLAIWCLTTGHGRFSGNWSWSRWGVSVWAECR